MGSAARRQLQIVPKKQFLVSPSERPPLINRLWKFVKTRIDFLVLVLITFASLTVWFVGESRDRHWAVLSFIDTVELHSLDARFRVRGARPPDSRIAIVGIDDLSLQKFGSYPIARNQYAKLIDQLSAGGAKVIALDMTFPLPEKNSAVESLKNLETQIEPNRVQRTKLREIERTSDNDAVLAASMKRANNVILGHFFLDQTQAKSMDEKRSEEYFNIIWARPFPQIQKVSSGRNFEVARAWSLAHGDIGYGIESNMKVLAEAAKSYGFFDMDSDADGAFRRAVLIMRYRDRDFFPSLDIQAVREYENIPDQDVAGKMSENGLEEIQLGSHKIKTRHDGTAFINYAGPYRTYQHYSMADVVQGRVPNSVFKGKIVLVGYTAKAVADLRPTPFQHSDYMGVEIHANIIDNILHSSDPARGFLKRGVIEEIVTAACILLFGLGLGYWFRRSKPLYATFSAAAVLLLFGTFVYLGFVRFGIWFSFVIPAAVLVMVYGTETSFRLRVEERERRTVRETFSRYVSPDVIHLIEGDPRRYLKAGGENKELSIMFCDIRSFTTLSEDLTPDELVSLLNEHLGKMTEAILKNWGTLDKYIGDAVMAFWGSPYPQKDHAMLACEAALEMRSALKELNQKWQTEGKKQLAIGIGISTGFVNVGNMGSIQRFAWTVMGDNVNLASRLEGMTKEYKVQCVVSEFTFAQIKDHFVCRELDRIRVKGKMRPVCIYELLALAKDAPLYSDLLARFGVALAAYRRQDWAQAIWSFDELLSIYPEDGPSAVLLERSREFQSVKPVPQWDGVYVMKAK